MAAIESRALLVARRRVEESLPSSPERAAAIEELEGEASERQRRPKDGATDRSQDAA